MKEAAGEGHCVVFRLERTEADGARTVEEREVRCSEEELAELLCRKWETLPDAADTTASTAERLDDAVKRALADVRIEVSEHADTTGRRRWQIGFGADNGARADELTTLQTSEGPVTAHGRLELAMADDAIGSRGLAGVEVTNQGVSVVNVGNVYAVLQLHLELNLRPEAPETS